MITPWGREFDQPDFVALHEDIVEVGISQLNQLAIDEAFWEIRVWNVLLLVEIGAEILDLVGLTFSSVVSCDPLAVLIPEDLYYW